MRNSKLSVLYILPFILLFFDFIVDSFEDKFFIVFTQELILLIILAFGLVRNDSVYNSPVKWLFFVFIYLFLIIPFSSSIFTSLNMYLKFSLSSLFYVYAFNAINKKKDFFKFINLLVIACFVNYFYFLYASIFQVGQTAYKGQIMFIGLQSFTSQFVFPIVMLTTVVFAKFIKHKRWYPLFNIVSLVILLLSFRRSNILILIIGVIFFILKDIRFKKYFLRFLPILVFIVFYNWNNVVAIFDQNSKGRKRIFEVENYAREGRVVENILVVNKLKESFSSLIFGSGELFFSEGKYGLYTGDEFTYTRPIHNDYARLLFGGGIIALVLFFKYLHSLYYFGKKIKLKNNDFNNSLKNYTSFLILIIVMNGFSTGLTEIFYRATVFILLGSVHKLMIINSKNESLYSLRR